MTLKTPKVVPNRSPIVAAVLSMVIPGLGQAYAGRIYRGFGMFMLALTMVLLIYWIETTIEVNPAPGTIPILITITVLFWIWSATAAYFLVLGRPFRPSTGLLLVALFTFIVGWQATRVNLVKFFTEIDDVFPIFTQIMWPWAAAVTRNDDISIVSTPFLNPCDEDDPPEAQSPGPAGDQWIIVDPPCGNFTTFVMGTGTVDGTVLTVTGGGFIPNEPIEIWWRDPLTVTFQPVADGVRIVTEADANGNFVFTFTAPQYLTPAQAVGIQRHQVQARQLVAEGPWEISPDFGLAVDRMIVTIFQALMATAIGIIFAIPLSFLAARNLMAHSKFTMFIYYALRFVMNVARSIEPIIWAVIATVWVGLGPFAGVIALTIHTIAALGKLYSEAIESIESGPIEAITATGANRLQTIVYAIVPQIIPPFLSFTLYRWDINVRMSTIIGFVGGGGIGQILFQWINQSRWLAAGMAVWLIALTVSIMDYASAELRKRYV